MTQRKNGMKIKLIGHNYDRFMLLIVSVLHETLCLIDIGTRTWIKVPVKLESSIYHIAN